MSHKSKTDARYGYLVEMPVIKRIQREEIKRLMTKFGEENVRKIKPGAAYGLRK